MTYVGRALPCGAYTNPKIDAIYDRIYVTLDPRTLTTLYQQLVQEAMGDMAQMSFTGKSSPC